MPAKPKPIKEKKPKKRKTKSERSLLEARCDLLVSTIVILRDGECVTCHKKDGLTCSHFVKREKHKVRWSLTNCNCQCFICNGKHNNWKEPYLLYMLDRYGADEVHSLAEAGNINAYKWSIPDLYELHNSLEVECQHIISLQTDPLRVEWARKRLA